MRNGAVARGLGIAAIAAAQAVAVIQIIGGATVSAWFPGLAMLWRQGLLWYAYWRLHPLWATLRQAVPQIELPRQPGTRFNIRYRLHRRVIEIRDAQLILKPYWHADISELATVAARSARLTAERRRAVVEAAVIVTALSARRQGTPARRDRASPEHASAALSNDLHAEAAHLILVSQAMRRSRIVRHLAYPPRREIALKRWVIRAPIRLTARRWGLPIGPAVAIWASRGGRNCRVSATGASGWRAWLVSGRRCAVGVPGPQDVGPHDPAASVTGDSCARRQRADDQQAAAILTHRVRGEPGTVRCATVNDGYPDHPRRPGHLHGEVSFAAGGVADRIRAQLDGNADDVIP